MTKKLKYCIILTVIIASFITSICVASGPGDDIHDGSEWKLSEDFIGSIANFWCRWVPIHFGTGVDAKLRDGEAAGSDIIYIDRTEGRSDDVTSVGYGLYQMDLRKHMVGYLYYLKSKASKDNPSSIAKQQMEHEEAGGSGVPETLKLKEACKYVADRLITTAYSKDTVTKYLDPILTDIEGMLGASEIKKHQSDFWYKVYGQKAYSLLTGSLGFTVPSGVNGKVQGAVLSIMEDRYRNKTLKNKTTMQLSVDKGDLWPFLVYTETEDNGAHTLWKYKEKENDTTYKTTDWEKMLEGAYQYMVYYEYKVDEEADSTDYITLYNGAKAEIFYSEYEELFGHPLRELKGEELDLFYQRIRRIRRYYKKSQDNSGGIFGEEEYDQSSDIAYSQAIQAIENKMNTEPFKEVFKSLDTENIARTYTMAKNIAANTRMIEQNAQYDIGSNIITRTPGGYDNNVLLTDLQLITLERDQNTGKYTDDADMDGLTDGFELGSDEGTYVNTNITGFIRQMMVAEGGEENADYLLNMYMQNVKDAKNDPEKMNKQDAQRDLRVEGNQIYVNLMSYKSNPIFKDTDFDGVWDGYGYDDSGNPIKENEPNDPFPLNSKISGTITTVENKTQDFETHMDYRYFFLDQYNYYDELSTMSLLLSNAVYDRNSENLSNLTKVNEKIGLNLDYRTVEEDKVKPYNYRYKTKYAIGYKPIEYSKDNSTEPDKYIKKLIIPVVIPGMTEISDGSSYSEIGSVNWADKDKPDIVDPESHNVKSYEMYASMILSDIESYERTVIEHDNLIDSDYKKVYWVTGYKEGGAIANILASKLIDNNNIVYSYTFGSPMTLYNNPDEGTYSRNGYRARYDCIFNVVNIRDVYCFIMPQNLGFSRYGMTCYGGYDIYNPSTNRFETNEESVRQILNAFNTLYEGNENRTREKTYAKAVVSKKADNYLGYYNVFKRLICAIDKDRNNKINEEDNLTEFYNRYSDVKDLTPLINALRTYLSYSKVAGTDDVYYNISKMIRNEDIQNTVNYYDNQKKRDRKATASQLYEKYPNYHALIEKDINNPVPSIFQDAEVWSAFRYGASYSKDEATPSVIRNSREIKTYNDSNYDYGTFWESACGATAPAIVLSYIFDKEITPIDVRDKLEENEYDYRPKDPKTGEIKGTSHGAGEKIAELYGLNCEHLTYGINDNEGNSIKIVKVVKSLLKGIPVICLTSPGPFGGGHYIVIAGVLRDDIDKLKDKHGLTDEDINKLKTRDKPLTDTTITSKIDALEFDDFKDISIYVLDPRYRHEYHPINNKKETMSTAWSIDTFKSGGDGKATQFWIYTRGNDAININQSNLFNYNKTKYPSNYEEYFNPQKAGDSDEFCIVTIGDDKPLGYFGKKQQHWKLNDFPNLVNYGG